MEFNKIYSKRLDETMYLGTHESGLRVCLMPKCDYVKSYAVIGTDFGSVNNEFVAAGDNKPTRIPDGVAHFLEHKLFEQPDGGNVFESYAKYGANANAYTSFDLTAYLFESAGYVRENLEILLDFVQKPYFTDENVAKEQGIIAQEIKMYDDEPSWRLMMNFLSSMFSVHPVRYDIAGSVESISRITKDTLYKCYNTFYDMSNMTLFIVGNIDINEIGECIEKNILHSEKKDTAAKKIFAPEPESVLRHTVSQSFDVSVPSFMFGFKDTGCGAKGKELLKKMTELSILTEIIFGKTGELHNKLYNEGYILNDLEAEVICERNYGFTSVSGDSREPEKVREIILSELDKIRKNGIKADDTERTKKALIGSYTKMFNDVSAIAHAYMSNIFKGISLFDFFEAAEAVTCDDIEKRFASYFKEENSVLSIVKPS